MVATLRTEVPLTEEGVLGGVATVERPDAGTPHMWIWIGFVGVGLLLLWSMRKKS